MFRQNVSRLLANDIFIAFLNIPQKIFKMATLMDSHEIPIEKRFRFSQNFSLPWGRT